MDLKEVQTENLDLTEDPFKNYKAVKVYTKKIYEDWKPFGFDITEIRELVHRYGRQTDVIFDRFFEIPEEDAQIRLAKAELWFGIQNEMILKPLDFFERRSGRLYFNATSLQTLKDPVLEAFSNYFDWDEKSYQKEKEVLEQAFRKIVEFK